MKLSNLLMAISVLAALSACSGDKPAEEQTSSQAQTATNQAAQSPGAPQTTPMAKSATASDPYQLPKSGKVIKAMHAGGYTYMQIEKDGKEFWVAATMMNVKRDDYVRWADAAVMKNFSSSTLHRTFDEILFVTNAELDQ